MKLVKQLSREMLITNWQKFNGGFKFALSNYISNRLYHYWDLDIKLIVFKQIKGDRYV